MKTQESKNNSILRGGNVLIPTVATLLSIQAASAALTGVTTTLLTDSQNEEGTALINVSTSSGAASGTSLALPGLTLGDGTVEEYSFVNAAGISDASAGTLNGYTSSTSGISDFSFPAGTLSGSDQFAFVNDGTTLHTALTGARASDVTWDVDTSAYDGGTIYVVFGSFVDFNQVTVSDGVSSQTSGFLGTTNGGGFDTTGTDFDFSGTTLANVGTAIAAFTFDNLSDGGANTTLNFRQINTDLDGSRARFYGVIVDGVPSIPEPSSLAFCALSGLALLRRRR